MSENVAIWVNDISEFGGLERVSLNLYKGLQEKSYPNAKLINLYNNKKVDSEINVISLYATSKTGKDIEERLSTVFQKHNITTLIVSITTLQTAFRVGKIAKKNSIKLIYINHTTPYIYIKNFISFDGVISQPELLLRKIFKFFWGQRRNKKIIKWMINNSYIVNVGHNCEKEFKKLFPKITNTNTIYNIIDIEKTTEERQKKYNKVLYMGRFSNEKNVLLLLDVWAKFNHLAPNYELNLVGDGEFKSFMQKKIERKHIRNVKFCGKQKDIAKFYKTADVCILTSFFEGLPTVFLEALSQNCPIFATKGLGGISELITPGVNGCYVKTKNPRMVAQALFNFLNNLNYPFSISALPEEMSKEFILKQWESLIG